MILAAIEQHIGCWEAVARALGKTSEQCRDRAAILLLEERGPMSQKTYFTPEDDQNLRDAVKMHGESDWEVIASSVPVKTVRQCRERWRNYLNPNIVKRSFTTEEDRIILANIDLPGNDKCTFIASLLEGGRTTTEIKNRVQVLRRRQKKPPVSKLPFARKSRDDSEPQFAPKRLFVQEPVDDSEPLFDAELLVVSDPPCDSEASPASKHFPSPGNTTDSEDDPNHWFDQ
jgi:hypothetical protein